ncbi:hypothetical protein GB881_04500 [Georgenia subflava]|uniref:CueP family metal-binding protein n=2 Tax=Georgenia subflava TaxID=1622177 RepID=A0A6N7EJE4_9MICO|nr:hypothetical protein [Georgenia subflava]
MVRRFTVALGGVALVLTGCAAEPETGAEQTTVQSAVTSGVEERLAAHGLDGLPATELIGELDQLAVEDRPRDLMASVRVDELVLATEDEEVALDLPEDSFYVSIAPFMNQTHECFYHSLTTCTGELGAEDVQVTIVDDAGEVLVDEQTTTYDNGFVGYWLPRDIGGTITVTHDGHTGEMAFSTQEDSPTCVTTLQLL